MLTVSTFLTTLSLKWFKRIYLVESYLILKTIHIIAAVLFLGNIIITGWWKIMANRTNNPVIISFAQRQVTLTDFIFTAGGSALLLITGMANIYP